MLGCPDIECVPTSPLRLSILMSDLTIPLRSYEDFLSSYIRRFHASTPS